MIGFRTLLLRLSESDRIRRLATEAPVASRVSRRFAAGETVEEALSVATELNDRGFDVTLDQLGEEVGTAEDAERAADGYVECLRAVDQSDVAAGISIKLTQLGLGLDEDRARNNLRRVVRAAGERGRFVWIDMESSDYTEATLSIFHALFSTHENLGVAVQANLRRTAEDVERLVEVDAPVRLVKGAYKEPPGVGYQNKDEVDRNFVRLLRRLLADGGLTAVATHDEKMIRRALSLTAGDGASRDEVEFQMLYGVRRELQQQLLEEGLPVCIYVPFGEDWFPYLMRRMAERPANMLFFVKALLRG